MKQIVSLVALLGLIALLGGMFYSVVAPFLLPLFMAAVIAIISQPLYRRCLQWTAGRPAWAAGLATGLITLLIVGPLVTLTIVSAAQLISLADRPLGNWRGGLEQIWQAIEPSLERAAAMVPGGLTDEQLTNIKNDLLSGLQALASRIATGTFSLASSTVGWLISLAVASGMFLTGLYYFLADGPGILASMERLVPIPIVHQRELYVRFAKTVRAVVFATFLAAFAQGLATAIALQVCGFGYFLVFVVVGSVASLIPLAGAWMVWGPCAAWLAVQGHWLAAIGLTAWGLLVVGILDNVVKMFVLQSEADLHPLIAFVSVIGALQSMGLWGVFIGPIVASCLFALVQIFNQELHGLSEPAPAPDPGPGGLPVPPPTPAEVPPAAPLTEVAAPIPVEPRPRPASRSQSRRQRRGR